MAEVTTRKDTAWNVAQAAAAKLRRAVEAADIVRSLRLDFGLSQQAIAEACGVSARAVREWENGARPRQRHDDRLRMLAALVLDVATTLTPRGVQQWLSARNPQLDWRRPVEALGAGDDAAVRATAARLIGGDVV